MDEVEQICPLALKGGDIENDNWGGFYVLGGNYFWYFGSIHWLTPPPPFSTQKERENHILAQTNPTSLEKN